MGSLLRSELFRVRKRPQSWLMPILATAFMAIIYGGLVIGTHFANARNAQDLREAVQFDHLRAVGLGNNSLFGGIMLAIFASGIFGNEYSWNTIRPLLARARSRTSLVTAKLVTVLLYSLAFTVALGVLTAIISLIATMLAGGSWNFSLDELGKSGAYLVGIIVGNFPYLALAVLVAMWSRSNAAGIGVSIGVSFIEPIIFLTLRQINDSLFTKIEKGGLNWNVQHILNDWSGSQQNWISVGVLLLYTVIFVVLTYRIFLRRDVTSG